MASILIKTMIWKLLFLSMIPASLSLSIQDGFCSQSRLTGVVSSEYLSSSMRTKRVWLVVNNKEFLSPGSTLQFVAKKNPFSSETFLQMTAVQNYNKQLFYYCDMPIDYDLFKIQSVSADNKETIVSSKWVYEIYPYVCYELFDSSAKIRTRKSDINGGPSTFILCLVISSFNNYSNSLDNGYGAYQQLDDYWVSQWAGAVDYTLDNLFFDDFSSGGSRTDVERTSVQEKINKLRDLCEQGEPGASRYETRNTVISVAVLVIIIALSLTTLIYLQRHGKPEIDETEIQI